MEKEPGVSVKIARAAGKTLVTVCYSPKVAEAINNSLFLVTHRSSSYYTVVKDGNHELSRVYGSNDSWSDRLGRQAFISDGGIGTCTSSDMANLSGLMPELAIANPGTPVTIWWKALDGRSFEDTKEWLTKAKAGLRLFVEHTTGDWTCEAVVYLLTPAATTA